MPTMKPKVKIKKTASPQAKDLKLLRDGYAELRRNYVDLTAEHGKLKGRMEAVEGVAGDHEDRLNNLEGVTSNVTGEVKCRCARGYEGKDPDCFVHGSSFDKSDRPSTTTPVDDVGRDANGSPVSRVE